MEDQDLLTKEQLLDRLEAAQWALVEITTPPEVFRLEGVHLTKIESRLLGALLKQPGVVVSKDGLLAAMHWDRFVDDWPDQKIVDVIVCKLRAKLPDGSAVSIETCWGDGYVGRIAKQVRP